MAAPMPISISCSCWLSLSRLREEAAQPRSSSRGCRCSGAEAPVLAAAAGGAVAAAHRAISCALRVVRTTLVCCTDRWGWQAAAGAALGATAPQLHIVPFASAKTVAGFRGTRCKRQ